MERTLKSGTCLKEPQNALRKGKTETDMVVEVNYPN